MSRDTSRAPTPLRGLSVQPEPCGNARRKAVLEALGAVLDPELDEPLLDLGFIHQVLVEEGGVKVVLRLPTFWCSAGFAYIMGEDIKAALGAEPWVDSVEVELADHFAEEKINRGLAEGRSFEAVFGREADGGLAELRKQFREKGFLGRQAAVIQAMRRDGVSDKGIAAMTCGALERRGASAGAEHATQIRRYLETRRERAAPSGGADPAFVDLADRPVAAGRLPDHLRAVRRVRGSVAANGAMCRILHAARYGEKAAPEPTAAVNRDGPGSRGAKGRTMAATVQTPV